jgi:hypothetical protein
MFVGSVRPIRGVCFVFGSSSHLLFSKTPPLPFCHPHSLTLSKMDWACFITIHRKQFRKLRARNVCGGLDCKTADKLSRDHECLKARNVYCTKHRMDEATQDPNLEESLSAIRGFERCGLAKSRNNATKWYTPSEPSTVLFVRPRARHSLRGIIYTLHFAHWPGNSGRATSSWRPNPNRCVYHVYHI